MSSRKVVAYPCFINENLFKAALALARSLLRIAFVVVVVVVVVCRCQKKGCKCQLSCQNGSQGLSKSKLVIVIMIVRDCQINQGLSIRHELGIVKNLMSKYKLRLLSYCCLLCHVRVMSRFCQGHVRVMSGSCLGHVRPVISMSHQNAFWIMPG